MNPKPSRNHHYVPQFYIRNFSKADRVFAFNLRKLKLFSVKPRNIVFEKDLYTLEGPEPLLGEELFGKIESVVAPIISHIIKSEVLPEKGNDHFATLLYFIASLILRHPRRIEQIENFEKTILSKAASLIAENFPKSGKIINGELVSQEDAVAALSSIEEGNLKIHIPRDRSLSTALNALNNFTELLGEREWTLAKANDDEFVTSSDPVLLLWDDLSLTNKYSPGFGHVDTTIYFPICPKLLMIGKFGPLKKSINLNREAVSIINGFQVLYEPQLVISKSDNAIFKVTHGLTELKCLAETIKGLSFEKA